MDPRYARQIALPGFGVAAQERLAASRVLVIGAGGLGSSVIPALVAAGVGTVGIIDDDRVELSNLHRQHIHGMADLGRSKVDSASASAAALNPDARVTTFGTRLTSTNALAMFADFDLVLDGSDNFPTRYLANDAAVLTGIPLVWGAVSQYGGQLGVSWGTTYRDLFPTPPPPGSVLSCEAGGVLPTTVGVIGALMATEALKLLTGIGEPLVGRVTVFDGLSGDFRTIAYEKDPLAEPITELIDYELFCGLAGTRSLDEGATLLDVREPWEVDLVALPNAVHIPLGELDGRLDELDAQRPVIAYCHHGVRSATAREILLAHGFAATHLEGGIDAWARDRDSTMARY
ncbi:MAG: ThiF family adenylyltransferase [Salinibacterium sp.]|nr:ThiF family adenylyltransferase [Salinibacterium sp.]